jgi:TubC N-terminal docking domain
MTTLDLLQSLEARGVILTPRGGRLIVDAPAGGLTAGDRDLLCRLKPDLLAILEASLTPDELPPDWHQLWDERAAIMEYDGGLSRERAEALALLDILEQMRRAGVYPRNDACI